METGEKEQLAKVFERLGAPREQALRMASQLMRRAEQLAAESNLSKVESVERLMGLCMEGFHGRIDPDFSPTRKKIEEN